MQKKEEEFAVEKKNYDDLIEAKDKELAMMRERVENTLIRLATTEG